MIEAPESIREATNRMKCLHAMMIEARVHARGLDGDVRGVRHVVVGLADQTLSCAARPHARSRCGAQRGARM